MLVCILELLLWYGFIQIEFYFFLFLYLEGYYDEVFSFYIKVIELNLKVLVYYGNRSFCYIKIEYYGCVFEDVNKVIELDKKYIKV